MPTFIPAAFATSATDATRVPSGATPILPLSVLMPHAIAVPDAAESVMTAFALWVRVMAW